MIEIHVRVYAELNDFLPPEQRQLAFLRRLRYPTSVKDLLEGVGVPHPEIGIVLIDGEPHGFDSLIARNCRVVAYPCFRTLRSTVTPVLPPVPPGTPRFVLDVHLGRLARHLRLLGFDTC